LEKKGSSCDLSRVLYWLCLEVLSKTTKNLLQLTQCPFRDSNWAFLNTSLTFYFVINCQTAPHSYRLDKNSPKLNHIQELRLTYIYSNHRERGDWVGSRASLDILEKRKNSVLPAIEQVVLSSVFSLDL
jgi:hypothetical protein